MNYPTTLATDKFVRHYISFYNARDWDEAKQHARCAMYHWGDMRFRDHMVALARLKRAGIPIGGMR